MAEVVNKPLRNGKNLTADLSILLTYLLCQGASKESPDELVEKYPTTGNCQRLEVVRIIPEILNRLRKDVNTGDVILQNAQKPLLIGITEVAQWLTDLMDASEAEDKAFSENLMTNTMQVLSDSQSS